MPRIEVLILPKWVPLVLVLAHVLIAVSVHMSMSSGETVTILPAGDGMVYMLDDATYQRLQREWEPGTAPFASDLLPDPVHAPAWCTATDLRTGVWPPQAQVVSAYTRIDLLPAWLGAIGLIAVACSMRRQLAWSGVLIGAGMLALVCTLTYDAMLFHWHLYGWVEGVGLAGPMHAARYLALWAALCMTYAGLSRLAKTGAPRALVEVCVLLLFVTPVVGLAYAVVALTNAADWIWWAPDVVAWLTIPASLAVGILLYRDACL